MSVPHVTGDILRLDGEIGQVDQDPAAEIGMADILDAAQQRGGFALKGSQCRAIP